MRAYSEYRFAIKEINIAYQGLGSLKNSEAMTARVLSAESSLKVVLAGAWSNDAVSISMINQIVRRRRVVI